ncbi:metabotropic glycine receptor-like [Amphiura filiformis]|uniref:metabotropic glycine receptor-like n=1 Tax=Amphiura filiformis TaxID=82378 RepID=UPI003B2261A4
MAYQPLGFTSKAIVAHCISDMLMCGSTSLLLLLLAIMCCPVGNYAFAAVEREGVSGQQAPSLNNTMLNSTDRASASNSKAGSKATMLEIIHQDYDDDDDTSGRLTEQLTAKKDVNSPSQEISIMDQSISSHKSEMQMLSTLDSTQYTYVNSMRGGQLRLKRARRNTAVSVDFKKEADPLLALIESLDKVKLAKECTRQEIDLTFGSGNVNDTISYYVSFLDNSSIAVYAANLLNSFYCRQRSQDSVFYHEQMLYSIVRNTVENNVYISGSCIAFDRYAYSDEIELFAPCTYYESEDHQVMTEVDMGTKYNYTSEATNATEWFTSYKQAAATSDNLKKGWLIHRYNETTNAQTEDASYAFVSEDDGAWTSPYFDCKRTNRWLVTYSIPFYNHEGYFLGVVTIDVDLNSIDVNQCDDGTGIFAGTHKCTNSTKCEFIPGQGFKNGAYQCTCADHYYFPIANGSKRYNGSEIELEYQKLIARDKSKYLTDFKCLPCAEGCDTCENDKPCFIDNNQILRAVILAIQSLFIVLALLLIGVVIKYRSLKVINCDSPWMLVVVLIGGVLLYAELVAMYFEPCLVTCYLQRWLRGWGFAIAYGMLVLKIYRKLAIFQTRSATRVLVRDRDVLKWLFLIIIVFSGYLAAWTAFSVQNMAKCEGSDILVIGYTDSDMKFYTCAIEWWDYVIEVVELLFLIFGIYLCYSVRGAPCEFHENRYISVAIYNETIFSLFLYVSRHFVLETIAPDWMFLMYFLRSQLTTTVMVSLIFLPKLLVVHKMIHDEQFRDRVNSRVVFENKWQSFRRPPTAASQTNNIDTHNMNPEDVREELKRLYTQLEIYKTKSLRIDNPHLPSKKRTGVKWRAPRRFSRGYSLRTHSGHSESERSSDIARSNESLTKGFELHDYRVNHVDPEMLQTGAHSHNTKTKM